MARKRMRGRIQLKETLNVYDAKTGKLVGRLVDISDMGIQLGCKKLIPEHTFIKLRLELPEVINDMDSLEFDAISTWNRTDAPKSYAVGFQMLNITPQDINTLLKVVEKYKAEEEE